VSGNRRAPELLGAFAASTEGGSGTYPAEIGPGIWDIHSPRVPAPATIRRSAPAESGAEGGAARPTSRGGATGRCCCWRKTGRGGMWSGCGPSYSPERARVQADLAVGTQVA
jgi:hypothetical protein